MRGNGPWGFILAPHLCKACFKEPISIFWGKLWTSIASHGFLISSWQNSYILANHTHLIHPIFHLLRIFQNQLCGTNGGWCYNKISPSLAIMGSGIPRDIYGCGTWNWWCGGYMTWWHLSTFCITITSHVLNLKCWGCSIILTQSMGDCKNMRPRNWPSNYRRWCAWNMMDNTRFH
jgi:hypothetical protein